MTKFTPSQIKIITDLYLSGKQQHEIATLMNCSQTLISQILRHHQVPMRVGKNLIYTDLNTTFFQEINCESSAYFLGFLYADGSVQSGSDGHTTSLKLEKTDLPIVERFRDIMSPSSPIVIYTSEDGTYARFRMHQKIICEQLISLGCVPNKSLILKFPTPQQVLPHLLRHFLRGYSDGDGSIFATTNKKRPWYQAYMWKIVSTHEFCQATSTLLQQELGIKGSISLSKPKTNQITTTLSIGGNQNALKVLEWLYQDATIYLPRKYDKYQECKQFVLTYDPNLHKAKRPDVNVELVIQDYKDGMYINDISAKHQVGRWFIQHTINKYQIPKRLPRKS